MKLFTLTKTTKEGCEASRCKQTEVSEVPGELWGRKTVKLCEKHIKHAVEFAEANPDYNPSNTTALSVADPELAATLKTYEKEASEALVILEDYPITGQKDLEEIGAWLQEVKARRNWLETKEKGITGPIKTSLEAVKELFRPAKKFWADAELALKAKIAEIKILEDSRNQESLDEAAQAAAQGDTEGAALATSKTTTVGDLKGISTISRWTFRVVNAADVPRGFLKVDDAKLREHCAKFPSTKKPTGVTGVEFIADISVRARAAQ